MLSVMTTVLRASDSAQFLGIVPMLAGFTPRRSVVLLPFRGTRTEGAMRLDLPDTGAALDRYAAAAIELVRRVAGTDAVAVVVYTDEDTTLTPDGLVLPAAVAVDHVLGCAHAAGLRIVDALCVARDGWSSYLEEAPARHPLTEIPPMPDLPEASDVSGDQFAGAQLPAVARVERERVIRALRRLGALLDGDARPTGRTDPQAIAALVLLEDIPAFFESVLSAPEELPPFATAALLWCLEQPMLRDTAIAQWATDLAGGVRTLGAQVAYSARGTELPDDIGRLFAGQGAAPDNERLRRALLVVRHAAALAPRAARPAPLTAAAWLSWALGRATHAGRYLDLARRIDPDYRLAVMIDMLIATVPLPEWAFRGRRDG